MKTSSEYAQKFIKMLENGKFKKHVVTDTVKEYFISKGQRDLESYKRYINSSAYDDVKDAKVKVYKGDNFY